jgi:hypothetical protein
MGVITLLSSPTALFAVMPNASLAAIVLTLFLTLGYTVNIAAMTLATIVVPGELRGLFVAVTVTGAALFCIGVAPLLVSGLSGALGGPAKIGEALSIVCGTASLLGAAVFAIGRQHFLPRLPAVGDLTGH